MVIVMTAGSANYIPVSADWIAKKPKYDKVGRTDTVHIGSSPL